MSTIKVVVGKYEYQVTGLKVKENKGGAVSGFVYALNKQDKSQYFGWFRWDKKYGNPIFGYTDQDRNKQKVNKGQIIEYIKWKLGEGTQQNEEVKQMKQNSDTVLYSRVIKECLGHGLTVAEVCERINAYLARGNKPDYEHLMAFINQYDAILEDELEADADYYACQQQRKAVEAEGVPVPSDADAPASEEEDIDNMPDHAE